MSYPQGYGIGSSSLSDVTRILDRVQLGDSQAAEELLPLVYEELRKLAAAKLAREVPGQTLQPTALVHEAWLRLGGSEGAGFVNRAHFFAAAAEAMRRILIERARRRTVLEKGGFAERQELTESKIVLAADPAELMAVHEALDQLAAEDPAAADLVKLRYFVGMTMPEAAEALGLPLRNTARRRKLPPEGEHLSIAVSLNELGLLRRAQGRSADAAPLLREALDRRTKVLRSDDSTRAESAENLALVLCDLSQFAEAEKLARQSVAIREQNYPDDWRRYNAMPLTGLALFGQKNYTGVEPLLLAGCQGLEERQARIPFEGKPRFRESLQRLVQLYEATDRPAEAAVWRQKVEGLNQPKP